MRFPAGKLKVAWTLSEASRTLRGMKKPLTLAVALVVAAAITAFAIAGAWTTVKSVRLTAQNPRTAFRLRIRQPKKILLYIGSAKVATTTRCIKGTTVSKLSRSFATDGSRNLLWHIPSRQDACHVSVSAAVRGQHGGYVSVDVYR
jgi:hypothetical protein